MGWYIRKSLTGGPFRLNLSRSGLGASFGVKGLRFGAGPRGNYVHGGTGGLYYRQSLGEKSLNNQPVSNSDNLQEIDSVDVKDLVDASSEVVLKELNRVQKRIQLLPIMFCLVILGFITNLIIFSGNQTYTLAWLLLSVVLIIWSRHTDVTEGTAVLQYDSDINGEELFKKLVDAFQSLRSCQKSWHIEASGDTADRKRNAGAKTSVRRKTLSFRLSIPPRVQSNLKVPTFSVGKQTLYFFPDKLFVYAPNGVGVVAYSDLQIDISKNRFIEYERVPKDAMIIDKTWKYVNKNGAPDKRFNDNKEIPIVQYEEMHLTSKSGLNELLMFSKTDIASAFVEAITRINSGFENNNRI